MPRAFPSGWESWDPHARIMPYTCWRLVAAGYEPAMSGQIEIKNESQASPMETPRAAQRYLSSESTRPAIADHPARRVPTFLRCRPRGGHRTGPGRRPAHHGPADLPRAPDTALRSRPLAGDRQRLVERDLPQRLPDASHRHPRRSEHQRRESPGTAADLCHRPTARADQSAIPAKAPPGSRAAPRFLVGESRARAAASARPAPDRQPRSEWSQPRSAAATPAADEPGPAPASGIAATQRGSPATTTVGAATCDAGR